MSKMTITLKMAHTFGKFKMGIKEVFLCQMYRKIFHSDQRDFGKNKYALEEILGLISGESGRVYDGRIAHIW